MERLRLFWYFLLVIDAASFLILAQVLFLTNTGVGAERIALEANVLIRVSLILTVGLAIPWIRAQWRLRAIHDGNGSGRVTEDSLGSGV
jgi:hypothetical protein